MITKICSIMLAIILIAGLAGYLHFRYEISKVSDLGQVECTIGYIEDAVSQHVKKRDIASVEKLDMNLVKDLSIDFCSCLHRRIYINKPFFSLEHTVSKLKNSELEKIIMSCDNSKKLINRGA